MKFFYLFIRSFHIKCLFIFVLKIKVNLMRLCYLLHFHVLIFTITPIIVQLFRMSSNITEQTRDIRIFFLLVYTWSLGISNCKKHYHEEGCYNNFQLVTLIWINNQRKTSTMQVEVRFTVEKIPYQTAKRLTHNIIQTNRQLFDS